MIHFKFTVSIHMLHTFIVLLILCSACTASGTRAGSPLPLGKCGTKIRPGQAVFVLTHLETKGSCRIALTYSSAREAEINIIVNDKEPISRYKLQSTKGNLKRIVIQNSPAIPLERGMHRVDMSLIEGKEIMINDIELISCSNLSAEELTDPNSDIKEFGIFEDSLVSDFTPWNITEKNSRIPRYILPAYIGSALLGVGLDGSGMQMLDCPLGRSKRYRQGEFSHTDDMYILGEGFVSSHIEPNNLMPLGYLLYSISIDGNEVKSPEELVARSTDWQRDIDIRNAMVTTSYTLDDKVRISITAFAPMNSNMVMWKADFKSTDNYPHSVSFAPEIRLTVRNDRIGTHKGKRLYQRFPVMETTERYAYLQGELDKDSVFAPQGDYRTGYLVCSDSASDYFTYSDKIGFSNQIDVKPTAEIIFETSVIKLSTEDSEPDSEGFKQRAEEFQKKVVLVREKSSGVDDSEYRNWIRSSFSKSLSAHEADWDRYFNSVGEISVNNPKRELLFNNSLYLFRIGGTYNNGLPICYLLHHPWCWHAATFWDLNFSADGLLHANDLDAVKKAAGWLNKVKKADGRTYPWIMFYNGVSSMQADWNDTGYHVNAAHAMTAIRLYETTKDESLLKDICYPIIRSVSMYAAKQRFIKDGDKYIGAGAAGDINGPEMLNDTFSTAWFGVILRKGIEYARLLGQDETESAAWQNIIDHLYLEKDDKYYHCFKGAGGPGGWMSLFLYPTETSPFLDMDLYRKTRAAQSFINDYYSSKNSQPWVYFWQASSDLRMGGRKDIVDGLIDQGMRYVYGPGYFAEITPDSNGIVGLPPIQTAHGAYLTAIAEQLILSSVWDNSIRIFTEMPDRMISEDVTFKRLRTSNGVLVDASYSPDKVILSLDGEGTYRLSVAMPKNVSNPGLVINKQVNSAGNIQVADGVMSFDIKLSKGYKAEIVIE
ncbi:MAG: hypothetical protein ACYC27_18985 [Armatimonadota bacterium]